MLVCYWKEKYIKTPYIHVGKDKVLILGGRDGLKALGEALIQKAKIGKNFSCNLQDGINIPIEIKCAEDIGIEDDEENEEEE